MRIAVVYVAQVEAGWASHKPAGKPAAAYLSHQLSCLSARLKNLGHAPYLVDGRSFNSQGHFDAVAKTLEFDVALVWAMPLSRDVAAACIESLRRAGKTGPIVAAGPAVSATGERLASETCDLIGEIDETFPALLEKFAANEPKIPGKIEGAAIANLEGLPEIDRGHFNVEVEKAAVPLHLLAPPIYTLTVGRGCPACHDATLMGASFRCKKCWSGAGEPAYAFRARDPRKWVDDVYRLTGSHGTGGVGSIVVHDSHLVDLVWLTAMASDWRDMVRRVRLYMPLDPRAINADNGIVRELARCGLTWAHFDVGHGVDRLRRVLGVPFSREEAAAAADVLKRNRVNLAVRVLSGLPGETDADMNATEQMLRDIAPTKIYADVWRPCPGTALWDDATRLALLSNDPIAIDGVPRPHVKGVDYQRTIVRTLSWPPAYEGKIVDLPADQWNAPPPIPQSKTQGMSKATQGIAASPAPHVAAPSKAAATSSGKTPPRDDLDDVIERCEAIRGVSAGTTPKVTVITAVHSKLEFLKEALASIETQTLREKHLIEHIIIDDASERADLREYLAYKDSAEFPNWRPRVIRFGKNVNNIAVSWNVALSVARGEYVCFLDADNRRLPSFLSKLVGALDADPTLDVAHCKSWIIDTHGNRTSQRGKVKSGITLAEEVAGNWIDSGEMVVRRSTLSRIGVFDERMKACEDWDLVTRLIKAGCKFKFIDEPLCEYRTHPAQRMNTSSQLGAGACAELIRDKANRRNEWDVRIVAPPRAALTASQIQVIDGITESVKAVECVRVIDDDGGPGFACDVALVLAPFRLGDQDIEALFRRVDNHGGPRRPQVVTLHMEDPQAVIANGRLLGRADWMVANDYSAMRHYRAKLAESGLTERAKRVLAWNSLGASPKFLRAVDLNATRDVDVLVLGYAYPSRQAIVKAFVKDAPTKWKIVCVGDGWADAMRGQKVECVGTQGEEETAAWCQRARAVLVTHRRQEDIGGFPIFPPESVHRGFLESAAGAVVLVDAVRGFGSGGVEFVRYSDGRDAAKKAFELLKDGPRMEALAAKNGALCRGELSMASRVRAILNSIRDERYNVVVP